MQATRNARRWPPDHGLAFAGMSCCIAVLLGLAAIAAAGSAAWLRGSLGVAGLVVLAVGGGLLLAHLVLDERHPGGRRR
jgi:hypothetical protein